MSDMARVPLLISTPDTGERSLEFRAVVIAVEHSRGLGRELIAAEPKNIN